MGKTLFERLWSSHVVAELGDGYALVHVDRHVVNDVVGPGFATMGQRGLKLFAPQLTSAVPDHMVPSTKEPGALMPMLVQQLRAQSKKHGIKLYDVGEQGFGIVHQMAPEEGIALPGMTFACGDSHSSTIGAVGALAWGIGQSEVVHIMATQTSIQMKPRSMRVNMEGKLGPGISAKDAILKVISHFGAGAGVGYAVEYTGSVIRDMDMDGRFTVCNMSVEMGARFGMVAPDETTYAYVRSRKEAPKGPMWDKALAHWRTLPTDADASFDKELSIDLSGLRPQVSWGTNLDHVVAIDAPIPDPQEEADPDRRRAMEAALKYMDLAPGGSMNGLPVDWVFIGSCTNARLADLQAAAKVAKGRRVAEGVRAWVVPGSVRAKTAAEAEGLDKIFLEAGFEWREPSCSMCAAANGDIVAPGQRTISTTNRNFEGRQGPGARTHLASPAMAAAAAIAGCITDVRSFAKA